MNNKFNVLIKPVMTEKAYSMADASIVFFQVAVHADKLMVKGAFENIFGAKVDAVRLFNRKGKIKRARGRTGTRSARKFAYIKLAAGQDFDLTSRLSGGV